MKLIEISLRNSTAVVVGIILTLLFGFLAFTRIPIQLNPSIESPYITVETIYPGASAIEVEQEVTQRMEEKLAAVENLREMRSTSSEGRSEIILKFDWGVNKDNAQLDVLQKRNLVEDLPDDVEEPQILTVNRREQLTVMWLFLDSETLDVNQMRQIADDVIVPQISRIPDVANIRIGGGAEREIHVLVDLAAIAARDLTLDEIADALSRENRNLRGGKIDKGPSRLVVRTLGQYTSLEEIRETVVKNGESGPIRIKDIAQVRDSFKDADFHVRVNGRPTVSMGVVQQIGGNTLELAESVKKVIAELNPGLKARGLEIKTSYDSSVYIWKAIYQLRDNLILGSILATAVLWIFLGSLTSTVIIGLTIPICMVGTFILLIAFGRSVNVVSLAGLAFASGMILDNGIVVLENIYRHRRDLGKPILIAARDGAIEVWAPIVAATLTTLAVFIPILFIQEQAGQLFRDLAYAISFAVGISMITAITVVPMFASRWLGRLRVKNPKPGDRVSTRPLSFSEKVHKVVDPFFLLIGSFVARIFYGIVGAGLRSVIPALLIIFVTLGMFFWSLALIPSAEYLPQGNENFILGMIKLPAGMSVEGADEQLAKMEAKVLSLPQVDRTFFLLMRDMPFFGVILKEDVTEKEEIQGLIGDLTAYGRQIYPFPDVVPIIFQAPVFARGTTSGKSVSIDVSGPDLKRLQELCNRLSDQLRGLDGVIMVRPSLDLGNPELQVHPDRERLADLGMTASDVARVVETLVEGRITSLYRAEGGKEYDLTLKALETQIKDPSDMATVMIPTPSGDKVRIVDVASIRQRLGPVSVERLEQERSATLDVTIRDDVPLEKMIDDINQKVIDPLVPQLPIEYQIGLSGSADDLVSTMHALKNSFLLALMIIYLLMAALFRSFFYPFIIMFSVPLAMTGAFLGIRLAGVEFNVITMLGFILLAGVVVNNAILIVQVTLTGVRDGLTHVDAIEQAVRLRIRPIFMTSVTSVLGMIPMSFGHGTGVDLYNGL
ncbi:MAG: efflux RND transporter permease subunit, partial [Candidatus Omnitrophica bacterium]|nr:efflux RND transporter permease subunit [Candidatus Omnitrophota bacterium]